MSLKRAQVHGQSFANTRTARTPMPLALSAQYYAVLAISFPSAACAAASRAIGTRNGEHDT